MVEMGMGGSSYRDQATGLRRLLRSASVRVLPVLGGRQAARIVAALAQARSLAGDAVLVIEQRRIVANHLGVQPRHALPELIDGICDFDAAAPVGANGVRVLAIEDGLERLHEEGIAVADFFTGIASAASCDLVLWHTTQPHTVPRLVAPDADVLVATDASEADIAASYQSIKLAAGAHRRFNVLVSGAADITAAMRTYRRIARTAEKFLGLVPAFGGFLPAESIASVGGERMTSAHSMAAVSRVAARVGEWQLAEFRAKPMARAQAASLAGN